MPEASTIAAPGYLYALSWCISSVMLSLSSPPSCSLRRRMIIWASLTAFNVLFTILTDVDIDALYFPILTTALLVCFVMIRLTSRVSAVTAVHLTLCSFLLGEWVGSLSWLLIQFAALSLHRAVGPLMLYGCYALTLCITNLLLWAFERQYNSDQRTDISGKELTATVILTLGAFLISNISNVFSNTPLSGQTPIQISQIRALVDFSGLMLLAASRIAREEIHRKNEAEMLEKVMALQQANFQVSEQTVALIHEKYHDLKHQIAQIRKEAGSGSGLPSLDRIESDIRGFEALCHTGNQTMDTVVTSKALQCQNLGIRYTCMADGRLLSFMSAADLSALLGNLLDNAIESVKGIEDPERRWIQLNLRQSGGFILLESGNPCDQAIQFKNGLPVTTKGSTDYHGYGTRSIRHIAERYGGSAVFSCQDGWFSARILFSAENA